jgi:hypothetical protein
MGGATETSTVLEHTFISDLVGRSERIRTSDPLLPKQVRYQAALHSVTLLRLVF